MPEDYLTFTGQNGEEGEEGGQQEMYEAMANTDEPLDLYEDPGTVYIYTAPPVGYHIKKRRQSDITLKKRRQSDISFKKRHQSDITASAIKSTQKQAVL